MTLTRQKDSKYIAKRKSKETGILSVRYFTEFLAAMEWLEEFALTEGYNSLHMEELTQSTEQE